MKIKELYDKDIDRRINPAVVVSELDDYFIKQEIREYVFTQGITKNIYKFLDAFVNKKEGKTGVWISGYYGSGKSHFIKYLFYCLDQKYRSEALAHFSASVENLDPLDDPNPGLVSAMQRKLETLDIDKIMFNIDAVSDKGDTKDRITRIFLNQLNKFRGFNDSNIALALYLEKPLQQKGFLENFKEKIKSSFNEDWEENQIRFARMYLKKVIQIAKELDSEIDEESLKSAIQDKNQDYTIEFLINELKEYLEQKPDDYRLVFLLDEMSQYIGSDSSLLLNLQTIVEEVGSQIGVKVWIVCTAQQDLSNLINSTDRKTEDFGKIMGRFETMISLESQDAAYITKNRILSKESSGIGLLHEYYKDNKVAIENQFVFDHDLYENFHDREDFSLTYPFVPYQFRLISDVFQAFSHVGYVGEGVKNTERSILGITHYTAKQCKERELGFFVPFDLFFNDELSRNLTHHARSILDRAYHIEEVKSNPFARRVVNALFMISNLGESQSVNFPANVENLALLLMESIDDPKLEMQNKVEAVLDVLVSKNIIQVSEGKYRFLKEDEIDVAHRISTTLITNEDRLNYIYGDIIEKIVKPSPAVTSFGNRTFRMAINIDDKEVISKGDFRMKFLIYDASDLGNIAHVTPSNDLVIAINDWFWNDEDLKTKLSEYVRTQKYISQNISNASGTRIETLKNFREKNETLLNEIRKRFETRFLQTAIISKQHVITPDELTGATPQARFQEMVKRHMEEVYRKHKLSNGYAASNANLLEHARSKQIEGVKELNPTEEELNNKIVLMGESPVVGDVVKEFDKPPYGWKDISTLDILLQIARKGHRRFEWRNEEIDLLQFAEKALNSRERDAITIHKEKVHSLEEIRKFIGHVNDEIFLEVLIPANITDLKEAVESFKSSLQPKLKALNRLKEEFDIYPFIIHVNKLLFYLADIDNARNPEQVMELVDQQKVDLKKLRDTWMMVDDFIKNNLSSYQQISIFVERNRNNFSSLDEMDQVKADELNAYLKNDHEPWEKFPQFKKAYRELHTAVNSKVSSLKESVTAQYKRIFEEIEAKRLELGIIEPHLTPDGDHFLQRLTKENDIAQLNIFELNATKFKADNFKILEDYKAKEDAKKGGKEYRNSVSVTLAAEMPPTTIETPEQLEEYINKLKERLMVKLAKNKKIFLN